MTPGSNTGPGPAPDHELLRHARKGRREAFDAVYRRYRDDTWHLAQVVAGDGGSTVKRAVGGAFARVVVDAPPRRGEACDLRALLLAATRDAVLAVRPQEDGATPSIAAAVPRSSPMASAFWSLPERWRTVVWLTLAAQLPPDDTAVVLGTSCRGVDGLIDRADTALADRLGPHRGAGGLGPVLLPTPVAPADLDELVVARWQDATSRRGRIAATVGSPGDEARSHRRRPVVITAGVVVAGVLTAIAVAPRGPHHPGDVPVAGPDWLTTREHSAGHGPQTNLAGAIEPSTLGRSDLVASSRPAGDDASGSSTPSDALALAPGSSLPSGPGSPGPLAMTAPAPGAATGPETTTGPGPAPSPGPLPTTAPTTPTGPITLTGPTTPTTTPLPTSPTTAPRPTSPPTTSTTVPLPLPTLPPPTLPAPATTLPAPATTLPPPPTTLPSTTTTLAPVQTLPPPTIPLSTTTTLAPISTVTTLITQVTTVTTLPPVTTVTTLSPPRVI